MIQRKKILLVDDSSTVLLFECMVLSGEPDVLRVADAAGPISKREALLA